MGRAIVSSGMYVRLIPGAVETPRERSQQFKRGDRQYRVPPGVSHQLPGGRAVSLPFKISIALDKRRADIDVDYRDRRAFRHGLFNGHLTAVELGCQGREELRPATSIAGPGF